MFFQKAVTLLYLAYGVQGERAFNFDTVCVISETHNGDFNGDLGSATLCKDHSVTGIDDCYVKLKYLYTITNISTDSAIRVQGITVPDNGENQEVTLDQTPIIKDAQVFAHHEVTKDFCDLSGLEISHLAVAVASYLEHDYGQDDLSRAGKVAPYMTSTTAFTVSDLPLPTAPLTWEMSPWDTSGTIVKCNIDDTSSVQTCEDYVKMIEADDVSPNTRDQCIQDVTFQYKYILTGDSCYTITSLQSELDGRAFVIGYDKYHSLDGFSCDDRKFCKGDEVMVDDKRTVDFCANAGRTVHFIGTINDVKAEEDNMRQKAPWTFPPISLDAPDTPPPASAPVPLTTTPSKTPTKAPAVADCKQCQGHPKEMYFQYLGSGNTCEKSENGLTTNCKEPSNPVLGRGKGAGKGASSTGGIGSTGGNKKPKKGKKGSKEFACDDLFTIADDPPKISVSDLNGRIYFRSSDDNPINKNGCFTASPANAITGKAIKAGSNGNKKMKSGPKMPSTTVVRIKNQDKGGLDENGMLKDQLAQTFTFHTSCSTPFFTGDTYGALKLIGWRSRAGLLFGVECMPEVM